MRIERTNRRVRRTLSVTGAMVLAAILPRLALAQGCLGQAEYEGTKYRVGAMSRTTSEANLYAATLGSGEAGSQFIEGFYGKATLSALPMSVTTWGLRTGAQMELRGPMGLQFCPFVSVENTEGSYVNGSGTRVGTKGSFYALSGALGARAARGEGIQFLPFIAGELRFASAAGAVAYEGIGGASNIASTMYETVTVGMGVVIHEAFTVRPTYFQPIGLKDGKSAVGFAVSWSF